MIGAGIDISLTATGLVVLETSHNVRRPHVLYAEEINPPKDLDRYARVDYVSVEVDKVIEKWQPHTIAVENYGQGLHRNVQSFIKLAEVGTMIRMMLWASSRSWYEVPPASLKKFVTGRGVKVSKKDMVHGVGERWGFSTTSDNIADGFGLACFALGRESAIAVEPWQVDAMDRVQYVERPVVFEA